MESFVIQFELLKSFKVIHGSFTREIDASQGVEKIKQALDVPYLIQSEQVHGNQVFHVENLEVGIPPCDALITSLKGVGLLIRHADCQAALFYDPVNRVIGAAHAGWRGACLKIYTKTIEAMKTAFNTNPQNLVVCISPSLGRDHAEFKNYRQELPEEFWRHRVKSCYFDFWGIAKDELIASGVSPFRIEIAGLCTFADPKRFFSYRRDKLTGRHGTVICLK